MKQANTDLVPAFVGCTHGMSVQGRTGAELGHRKGSTLSSMETGSVSLIPSVSFELQGHSSFANRLNKEKICDGVSQTL